MSWQYREDTRMSFQTHSPVLLAFLPTRVSAAPLLTDISGSLSLIPRCHIVTATLSLSFLPHPSQSIVLHSYLFYTLDHYFHSFSTVVPEINLNFYLSLFSSPFLPLPLSLFLPPLPPSLHISRIKSLPLPRPSLCS